MHKSISFLIDENLPAELAEVFRSAGHDVVHVKTSDLRGARDEYLWELAAREQRILITSDLDFPIRGKTPPPGLIIVRLPSSYGWRDVVELFQDFLKMAALELLEGHITVIRPSRPLRQRPFSDL